MDLYRICPPCATAFVDGQQNSTHVLHQIAGLGRAGAPVRPGEELSGCGVGKGQGSQEFGGLQCSQELQCMFMSPQGLSA